MNWFDFIGYAGALVIIFASTYTSIKRYRLYNVIGAGIFLVYGIIANIVPVIILMSCLMFINFRKMMKPISQGRYYTIVDMKLDDPMFVYLLELYKREIKGFFPQYKINDKINVVK
ncbi:MAG: hypothetical protein MJ171_05325, partial [Clostridia bacterium]|nr:hypothetical protein [Clostridia bacterium]